MEKREIKDLIPANYNPRKISGLEFEKLVNSIKEFGFVEPVIINKDFTIIGGHQRTEAAKSLGFTEVPVVMVDLTKEKEKALNLALNRIEGVFDEVALKILLEDLEEGERSLTGFDVDEITRLLNQEEFKVDKARVEEDLSIYLNASIKQIVLYFKKEDFGNVIAKLERIMSANSFENHTEVFEFMLDFYEKNKS